MGELVGENPILDDLSELAAQRRAAGLLVQGLREGLDSMLLNVGSGGADIKDSSVALGSDLLGDVVRGAGDHQAASDAGLSGVEISTYPVTLRNVTDVYSPNTDKEEDLAKKRANHDWPL